MTAAQEHLLRGPGEGARRTTPHGGKLAGAQHGEAAQLAVEVQVHAKEER